MRGWFRVLGRRAWRAAKLADQSVNDKPSFWARYNPSDRVIVFVHGLMSNGQRAWAEGEKSWIDVVLRDRTLSGFDVYVCEWYTSALSAGEGIEASGLNLLGDLESTLEGKRPLLAAKTLVFVCHSMGGLVVRQMLVARPDLLEGRQVAIMSYGTPAHGVPLADRMDGLAEAVGHQQAIDLQTDSPKLEALSEEFKRLLTEHPGAVQGAEFVESHLIAPRTKALRWADRFLPRPKPLVGVETQGGYFGKPIVLRNTDHRSVSRADSRWHPSHVALLSALTRFGLIEPKKKPPAL